jgi:hypothetical protein
LIKGLLRRFAGRTRQQLGQGETLERMAETYVEHAIKMPNEYSLFYKYVELMSPRKGRGAPRPIRESRPNFAFTEQLLAKNFGGRPEEHTHTALILWALLHGTAMLLLSKSIPEGHERAMREACRAGVRAVLMAAQHKK